MLGLPHTTLLHKPLPKKSIYAKFGWRAAQQEKFDADISRIFIEGEVSPATTSIAAGAEVSGFYVISIVLKRKEFDPRNVVTLSKLIDQNMLFLLQHDKECMLALFHTKLLCTEWMPMESANIPLAGLNFDTVWQNIVIAVARLNLDGENTIEEQIAQNEEKEKLLRKIEQLERKARTEKQPRRKLELVEEIKKLKQQIN